MISVCNDALQTYGDKSDNAGNIAKAFHFVLADYTIEQIRDGFKFYLKHYSKFPTPAEISDIIERGGKPPLSESMYIKICKKHPEDRDYSDWEYMKEYERFQKTGRM